MLRSKVLFAMAALLAVSPQAMAKGREGAAPGGQINAMDGHLGKAVLVGRSHR
jgi:hypothetical protein